MLKKIICKECKRVRFYSPNEVELVYRVAGDYCDGCRLIHEAEKAGWQKVKKAEQ